MPLRRSQPRTARQGCFPIVLLARRTSRLCVSSTGRRSWSVSSSNTRSTTPTTPADRSIRMTWPPRLAVTRRGRFALPQSSLRHLADFVPADLTYLTDLLARHGLRLGDYGIDAFRSPARKLNTERYAAM